jgi:hypothetical protein
VMAPGWAVPPTTAPPHRSRRRRLAVGLLAALVGLFFYGASTLSVERDGTGQIVDGGLLDPYAVRVGDCIKEAFPAGVAISSVEAVPCGEPHMDEVYHIGEIDLPAYDDAAVEAAAEALCMGPGSAGLAAVVAPEELYIGWMRPSFLSWADGDREIACLAGRGEPLVGAMLAGES